MDDYRKYICEGAEVFSNNETVDINSLTLLVNQWGPVDDWKFEVYELDNVPCSYTFNYNISGSVRLLPSGCETFGQGQEWVVGYTEVKSAQLYII